MFVAGVVHIAVNATVVNRGPLQSRTIKKGYCTSHIAGKPMRVPPNTWRPLPPDMRRLEVPPTLSELAISKAKFAAGYTSQPPPARQATPSPEQKVWLTEPLTPSEVAIAKAKAAVARHRSVAARIEELQSTHAARAAVKDQLAQVMGCKAAEDATAAQADESSYWRHATERRLNSSHAQCEECGADALPASSALPVSTDYALLRPENNAEMASRVLALARERPASGRIHGWRRLNAQRKWRADGEQREANAYSGAGTSCEESRAARACTPGSDSVSLGGIDAHGWAGADFGCGFEGCKHIDLRRTTPHGLVRHRQLCPFRPVECRYCGAVSPHYLLKSHTAFECPNLAGRANVKPLASLDGLSVSTQDLVPRDMAIARSERGVRAGRSVGVASPR